MKVKDPIEHQASKGRFLLSAVGEGSVYPNVFGDWYLFYAVKNEIRSFLLDNLLHRSRALVSSSVHTFDINTTVCEMELVHHRLWLKTSDHQYFFLWPLEVFEAQWAKCTKEFIYDLRLAESTIVKHDLKQAKHESIPLPPMPMFAGKACSVLSFDCAGDDILFLTATHLSLLFNTASKKFKQTTAKRLLSDGSLLYRDGPAKYFCLRDQLTFVIDDAIILKEMKLVRDVLVVNHETDTVSQPNVKYLNCGNLHVTMRCWTTVDATGFNCHAPGSYLAMVLPTFISVELCYRIASYLHSNDL